MMAGRFMWPRITPMVKKILIANVVVFVPPPVDPGDAPTNIHTIIHIMEGIDNAPTSTVLNPAVLVVTDWKRATMILLPLPDPDTFRPSSSRKSTAPDTINPPLNTRTTLLCKLSGIKGPLVKRDLR